MLFLAVEDVDFQAPGIAQQPRRQATAEQPTTQAPARLADQHQAGPAFGGMLDQGLGHFPGPQQHHFAAQPFRQLLGTLQAQSRLFVAGPAVIHMHQAPGQVPALRDPAGVTHQALGLGIAVDPHQQASTNGRRGLAEGPVALGQIVVDLGRGGLHRQFAQGGEVGLGEKRIDRRPRLFRHIDLAVAQALQQFPGRQVDQQQFVGLLQDPVGQGLAHLHPGDPAHLVIEAFQVLDIDRGEHVDTGGQQFLDILPALHMATVGGIAVGQLIDQHQFRPGLEQTVEVHFLQHHATVLGAHQGLLRQTTEQGLGFGPAVGFHHPGDQFHALAQLRMGGLQHCVGLAHARGGTEEHLEPATTVAGQFC